MRIAVWHNLPSGGGKRALYYHVRGLVERGHSVEAWCPSTSDRNYLPLSELITEHVVPIDIPQRNKFVARRPLLRELHGGSSCAKRRRSMNTARGVRMRSTAGTSIFCLLILQSFRPSPQLAVTLRQRRCFTCRSLIAGCTRQERRIAMGCNSRGESALDAPPRTYAGFFAI